MNKKHRAVMIVIVLSLLVFAFALPKASFAANNLAEGNVAFEETVDIYNPINMTKEDTRNIFQ